MVMKNRTSRFIVLAAIALLALLATGCENPANSSSHSVGGDTADAEPHTLVLPAGTVQGWETNASGTNNWHIKYYGNGESNSSSLISFTGLGIFSMQNDQYPGQTHTRSDIESRLTDNMVSNTIRPWPLADTTENSLVVLSPNDEIKAIRVSRLSGKGSLDESIFYDLVRRSADRNTRIEWWYVEADSTATGVYDFNYAFYRFANDVQLSAGWNTIVLTRRTPSSDEWDVSVGSEPSGMSWHLYSSANSPQWYE
ncbi:MAG: hypothetical protein ACLFSV_10805 [Alkalispirochaeta sp.]